LLRTLGGQEGGKVPPALRAQLRQLEEEQKRRARRALLDVLDRALVDLLSFYRDVLVVQLGADVELVNRAVADQVRSTAGASTPETSVHRMQAIGQARTRMAANAAPLLTIEAMVVALRPQA